MERNEPGPIQYFLYFTSEAALYGWLMSVLIRLWLSDKSQCQTISSSWEICDMDISN